MRLKNSQVFLAFILLLTALLVTLKIVGIIAWAWVWVLAPLWITFILYTALVMMVLFAMIIVMAINEAFKDR